MGAVARRFGSCPSRGGPDQRAAARRQPEPGRSRPQQPAGGGGVSGRDRDRRSGRGADVAGRGEAGRSSAWRIACGRVSPAQRQRRHRQCASAPVGGDRGVAAPGRCACQDLDEALYTLLMVCFFGGRQELWPAFGTAVERLRPRVTANLLAQSAVHRFVATGYGLVMESRGARCDRCGDSAAVRAWGCGWSRRCDDRAVLRHYAATPRAADLRLDLVRRCL
jgi:hypothetical protein